MNAGKNHIQNSTYEGWSWCGKPVEFEFAFADTEAAVINGNTGARIPPCEDCVQKIIKCLTINGK